MKTVNENFDVSHGAQYVLVSPFELHILGGVAEAWGTGSVAQALEPGSVAISRGTGSVAISRGTGSVAQALTAGSVAISRGTGSVAFQYTDLLRLADDEIFELIMTPDGFFYAGCRRRLTREEALKHWDREDDRACLFTLAIGICT